MIERYDVNEDWAHSGLIKVGNFVHPGYCVGNIGGTIEEQVNGAFDHMEKRLKLVGLTLENVVQMDCCFKLMELHTLKNNRKREKQFCGFFTKSLFGEIDGKVYF